MPKKVGIITYHRSVNYGAVLQAYALSHALKTLDCSPEVIDYRPACRRGVYTLSPFWSRETIRRLVQADGFSDYLATHFIYRKQKHLRNQRFQAFIQSHIPLSEMEFSDIEALRQHSFDYDAFVCGSDQIWNTTGGGRFDPGYFLDFVDEGKPRISYAPSFGGREIPDGQNEVLTRLIDRFSTLSVREKSGEEIVRQLTGRTATQVLDPTFLLDRDDWDAVASDAVHIEEKYVFCYCPAFSEDLIKYALQLKRHHGLKIIVASNYGPTKSWLMKTVGTGIETLYNVGPAEFLHLYSHAEMILTTTFHGTAFALNFQKPFYTWLRPGTPVNARIEELLGSFALSSRMILGANPSLEDAMEIDFEPYQRELAIRKAQSLQYLRSALQLKAE